MNHLQNGHAVRISSPAGLLAVVPHLLGFTPEASLVVIGVSPQRGRVRLAFRYDLPDPPEAAEAAGDRRARRSASWPATSMTIAVVAGYGPGPLVTPLADAIRAGVAAHRRGACVTCCACRTAGTGPTCAATRPAARPRACRSTRRRIPPRGPGRRRAAGAARPGRAGRHDRAGHRTRRRGDGAGDPAGRAGRGPAGRDRQGRAPWTGRAWPPSGPRSPAYRDGRPISSPVRHAWLSLVLTRLRVRDDAWARMDPAHRDAHRRLWTDLVRRAQPGYVAAPASLLAFTAWQCGDGALANIALDRALADTPGYSMAAAAPRRPRRRAAALGGPAADDPRGGRRQLRRPASAPAAASDRLPSPPCAGRVQPGPRAPAPRPLPI